MSTETTPTPISAYTDIELAYLLGYLAGESEDEHMVTRALEKLGLPAEQRDEAACRLGNLLSSATCGLYGKTSYRPFERKHLAAEVRRLMERTSRKLDRLVSRAEGAPWSGT